MRLYLYSFVVNRRQWDNKIINYLFVIEITIFGYLGQNFLFLRRAYADICYKL